MAKTCLVKMPPIWAKGGKGALKRTPAWAIAIASLECKRQSLTLWWTVQRSWRRSHYVSGTAHGHGRYVRSWGSHEAANGPIVEINAGIETTYEMQLWVLLHEIAHINVGTGHAHDKVWQKEAIRLYRKHGMLETFYHHAINKSSAWNFYACERKAIITAYNRSKPRTKTRQEVAA